MQFKGNGIQIILLEWHTIVTDIPQHKNCIHRLDSLLVKMQDKRFKLSIRTSLYEKDILCLKKCHQIYHISDNCRENKILFPDF